MAEKGRISHTHGGKHARHYMCNERLNRTTCYQCMYMYIAVHIKCVHKKSLVRQSVFWQFYKGIQMLWKGCKKKMFCMSVGCHLHFTRSKMNHLTSRMPSARKRPKLAGPHYQPRIWKSLLHALKCTLKQATASINYNDSQRANRKELSVSLLRAVFQATVIIQGKLGIFCGAWN